MLQNQILIFVIMCCSILSLHAGEESMPCGTWTKLHAAALKGKLERARLLIIDDQSLVHQKDEHGDTPLHIAVLNGHVCVVALLIEQKADINARCLSGNTPLHRIGTAYATDMKKHEEYIQCVRLLLSRPEILCNAADNAGETPLHLIARYAMLLRLLIERTMTVNAHNKSALEISRIFEQLEEPVRLLLAHGADVTKKNEEGIAPADLPVVQKYLRLRAAKYAFLWLCKKQEGGSCAVMFGLPQHILENIFGFLKPEHFTTEVMVAAKSNPTYFPAPVQ